MHTADRRLKDHVNQGLVNVLIEHHPNIGDIISNRSWFKWCSKSPKLGHLPNLVYPGSPWTHPGPTVKPSDMVLGCPTVCRLNQQQRLPTDTSFQGCPQGAPSKSWPLRMIFVKHLYLYSNIGDCLSTTINRYYSSVYHMNMNSLKSLGVDGCWWIPSPLLPAKHHWADSSLQEDLHFVAL